MARFSLKRKPAPEMESAPSISEEVVPIPVSAPAEKPARAVESPSKGRETVLRPDPPFTEDTG
jgi:hypothetical protein